MTVAQQLTDPVAFHGEGAVWHSPWGGIRWVDMFRGDILALDEASGAITRRHVSDRVAAAFRPRTEGGFVVATERGFAAWDPDDTLAWETGPLWDEDVRFNEGACDPQGRFLCGTMAYSREEGAAAVWRLSAGGRAERLFGGVTISNGIGFTTSGTRAYYVDSRTRRIDVFDVDAGELTGRRPFVSLPDGVGGPDGICLDAEDGVWVALYNGSAVRHYDRDGSLDAVVQIPVSRPTSCALGGDDLRTLYVTTSRENLADSEEPLAGSLFTTRVDTPGLPVRTAAL